MLTRIDTDAVSDAIEGELCITRGGEEAGRASRAFRIACGRTTVFNPKQHVKLYTALMALADVSTDETMRRRAFEILREELGV